MNEKLVPDMMMPVTRPRSAGPNKSATNANPTTHVMASAAPWMRRAANNTGRLRPNANRTVDAARVSMPSTSGIRRPIRSEAAPIGIDTVSSVTPKEANSRPTIVGEAPRRRLRSGRTGTATE